MRHALKLLEQSESEDENEKKTFESDSLTDEVLNILEVKTRKKKDESNNQEEAD